MRRNILLSTDHGVIGLQQALTSLCFLLIGFTLVVIIRWQLVYPGTSLVTTIVLLRAPGLTWSVIVVASLLLSLYGASIRFTTLMLFALTTRRVPPRSSGHQAPSLCIPIAIPTTAAYRRSA